MSALTLFDTLGLTALLAALAILLLTPWKSRHRDVRWIILVLLGVMSFDRFSNVLEWSHITAALDQAEGYLEVAQPLVWGLLIYGLIQKETRKRLLASEERYRTLVNNIDLGISLVDKDYRVQTTNIAHGHLFGNSGEDIQGRPCFAVLEDRERICPDCPGRRSLETGEACEEERQCKRSDGSTFIARIQTFPVFDKDEQTSGFIEVVEDITDKRADEAELAERARRLEILFDVSHVVLSEARPDEVAETVLSKVSDVLEAAGSSVALIDTETGKATILSVWPPDRDHLKAGESLQFHDRSLFNPLRDLEPVVLSEKQLRQSTDKRLRHLPDTGIRSLISIPLQYRERLLGALNFSAEDADHFTPQRIRIAREAANILAIGIHHYSAAEALEHENKFRETLINNAAEGIAVCHAIEDYPNIRFTVWNRRMEEITGYTCEQINNMGLEDSVHTEPVLRERALDLMDRIRQGENLVAEEWEIRDRSGNRKLLSISTSVIIDREGLVHVLGVMTDITERRKEEEEQRRFEEKVRHTQKLESLGVLAGGIAHDFNNLLVSILGNTDMALKVVDSGHQAADYLQDVQNASQRAADLCRQLLAYSGRGRFQIQTLDLNHLVREMVGILDVSISKNAELRCELAEDIPSVRADVSQIQQVVMNLIVNASEALQDNRGVITISTGVTTLDGSPIPGLESTGEQLNGEFVTLDVRDSGCGMDSETRQRLFEPFFTTKFTGRGLGMSAVLGIIRGHHGGIQITTKADEGTHIRVLLPVAPAATHKEEPAETQQPGEELSGAVLVVDDEEIVRKLAQRMLEWMGLEVRQAADGVEALQVLREDDSITMVLLDLTMPRMDGVETLAHIREDYPGIPVLMTSGYDQDELSVLDSREKPDGFIKKPFTSDRLQNKLGQVLSRSHSTGQTDPPLSR